MPIEISPCPLCDGVNAAKEFPYSVTYEALSYTYLPWLHSVSTFDSLEKGEGI